MVGLHREGIIYDSPPGPNVQVILYLVNMLLFSACIFILMPNSQIFVYKALPHLNRWKPIVSNAVSPTHLEAMWPMLSSEEL